MSERATLFLSSIGLLGEYCPTSRKKYSCAETIGCMHLELPGGHSNSPRVVALSSCSKNNRAS